MALDDDAVVVAATGYVFINNTLGATPPTPAELDALDPEVYGTTVGNLKITGAPTAGTFTVSVGGTATAAIPYNASVTAVQNAIEALVSVGAGKTKVWGISLTDAAGVSVAFLDGADRTFTATGTFTGGTSPAVAATKPTTANGWINVGHTSRDDMPEFGFDGGDTEIKGTWQKKRLREVQTGDPLADSVGIHLSQWDRNTLRLYFGADTAATAGIYGVSGDFKAVEVAILILIIDDDVRLGFYASKASVKRDDSIGLPVDDLSSLPIKATFLNLGARRLYDWISDDLF
jgi:hypothetical protein